MNQREVVASNQIPSSTSHHRIYTGSFDCAVQVSFILLTLKPISAYIFFSYELHRQFETKDLEHCTKDLYQHGSEWDHGILYFL